MLIVLIYAYGITNGLLLAAELLGTIAVGVVDHVNRGLRIRAAARSKLQNLGFL